MKLAAALACALAAAGCQRKNKPADQAAAAADAGVTGPRLRSLPPTPTVFPPEPPAEMPRELRFQLLEPGKGKRVLLRYRGGGAARELPARAVITTHAYADGTWSDELTLAPVRDGFGISVDPAGDGAFLVHLRPLAAAVDGNGATPAALAAAEGFVTRWRALLEKRRADVTIDARGRLTAAGFLDDPAAGQSDARDELVQRWLGLVVPLPEEPVAPGARWRVVTLLRTGGAVVRQNAVYKLVSAGDAGWTVEVSAERIGQPQDISIPGVAGSPGELVALRRLVTGTFALAPADPLPLRGTLTAEVSTHARFRLPGGRSSERYTDDRATITLGP